MGILNKRKKIISAAIREFAKQGFEKASVDTIALKAEVAKGTVFYYFNSKNELFKGIVSEAQKKFEEKLEKEIGGLTSEKDKIEKIIEIEVNFIQKYRDLFFVYLGDTIKNVISIGTIENVLKNGVEKGEFRENLNIKTTSVALFWLTAMTCLNSKEIKAKEIRELVMEGILK